MALGSNLGDRDVHLEFALRALVDLDGVEPRVCSPVYETDPVGPREQPPYLNAVLSLETSLVPAALLEAMLDIEERAGRSRRPAVPRWSSRSLDLDLLLYGDRVLDEPGLSVPHPRLPERLFVLLPLCEVAAGERDPRSGETFDALARRQGPAGSDGPVSPPLIPKIH